MNGRQIASIVLLMFPWGCLQAQHSNMECGLRCLFVAIHSLNEEESTTLIDLNLAITPTENGNSLEQLHDAARQRGYNVLAITTTLEALRLRNDDMACIAHLSRGHYVLIVNIDEETIEIADPPKTSKVPISTFTSEFSGNVLLISQSRIESEESVQSRLWWIRLRRQAGYGIALVITLALTALLVRSLSRRSGMSKGRHVKFGVLLLGVLLSAGCTHDSRPATPLSDPTETQAAETEQLPAECSDPPIRIDPPVVDLGNLLISMGTVQADFTIMNNHSEEISITQIQTSCGCTIAAAEKSQLAPGESTKIVAAVNLTQLGPQSSRLRIHTSLQNRVVEVLIKWKAGSVIRVHPSGIYSGAIQCGKSSEFAIELSPPDGRSLDDCVNHISWSPDTILCVQRVERDQKWLLNRLRFRTTSAGEASSYIAILHSQTSESPYAGKQLKFCPFRLKADFSERSNQKWLGNAVFY